MPSAKYRLRKRRGGFINVDPRTRSHDVYVKPVFLGTVFSVASSLISVETIENVDDRLQQNSRLLRTRSFSSNCSSLRTSCTVCRVCKTSIIINHRFLRVADGRCSEQRVGYARCFLEWIQVDSNIVDYIFGKFELFNRHLVTVYTIQHSVKCCR